MTSTFRIRSLVLITGLAALIAPGSVSPVAAQPEAAESVVRDALENAIFAMQLEDDSGLWFDTDVLEFFPASSIAPGGGFIVSRDLTYALILGAPYELPRWALRTQDGAVIFSLTYFYEGEPLGGTIEGPISPTDSGHLTVDLRGNAEGPDGIEEMVVSGSLIPLDSILSGKRIHKREALFAEWTLDRLDTSDLPPEGEHTFESDGKHPITYAFDPGGTFEVEVEGGLGSVVHPELLQKAMGGYWFLTRDTWEWPPLTGESEDGQLLILVGDAPVPDVFMIRDQSEDSLVIKSIAPSIFFEELVWVTLHLRR